MCKRNAVIHCCLLPGEGVCSILPPEDEQGRPPKKTASLILVDRALDFVTPCQHSNHIIDRIFGVLPRAQLASSNESGAEISR